MLELPDEELEELVLLDELELLELDPESLEELDEEPLVLDDADESEPLDVLEEPSEDDPVLRLSVR